MDGNEEPPNALADPVAMLHADRAAAHAKDDPNASLCVLASVAQGEPEARTLVLRDVAAPTKSSPAPPSRLGVFVNSHSPKHAEFAQSTGVAVLVYLPSVRVQYRLRCALEAIPPAIVHANWQLRPPTPKRLDWLYAEHPQGSVVESRRRLEALLDTPLPAAAPDSAVGYYLAPNAIDRLCLNQSNGLHDRRRYERRGDTWQESVLVP